MIKDLIRPLLVCGLVASAVAPCLAQDPAPRPRLPQGLVLGGAGMEGPRIRQLITRPDVQRGLGLNVHQQNEVAELFKDPANSRVAVRLESRGETSPEDLRRSAEEQIRAQMGSLEDKIKKILKPEQFDRFREIDLQWRGPLALADNKVAERLKIEATHRQEIEKAAAAYRQEKQEVLMSLAERQDDGAGRIMVRMNANPKQLENPLSPESKQLTKAKQEAEKKILEALSADERTRWNKSLGEPFTFRTDIPGNRF